METGIVTPEATPAGNGKAPMPHGFSPLPLKPPSPARATDSVIGVEVGAPIASDGSLPLRASADAMETMRSTWQAVCTMHAEQMARVSPVVTEVAAQLKSRDFFFTAKQRSLRQAENALAEVRVEVKRVEERIARQTVPPISREDAGAAIVAGEVRAFLRGLSEPDRLSALERAIAAGDVQIVAAALAMPVIAGLSKERADLIAGRWRKVGCPEELQRIEVLQKTADRVEQAAQRLQRRFDEGYDHRELDALEASSARAA